MSDLDMLSDIPGFTAILKAVLKSQIQFLVDQLAERTGEDYFVLTANVLDGSLGHLGSKKGKSFLDTHAIVKSLFLGHCMKDNVPKPSSVSSDRYGDYQDTTASSYNSSYTSQEKCEVNGTVPVSRKRQLSETQSVSGEVIPAKLPYRHEEDVIDITQETSESSVNRDVSKHYNNSHSYLTNKQETNRVVPHEEQTVSQDVKEEEGSEESGADSNRWPMYGYDNSYTTDMKTSSVDNSVDMYSPSAGYPWYPSVSDSSPHPKQHTARSPGGGELVVDISYAGTLDSIPEGQQTDDEPGRHKTEKQSQYACDICARVFNRKYNMMQHRQLHLGIKQFECDICKKQFARQDRLKFHQLKHHSGIDFKQKFMENVLESRGSGS